MKVRITSVPNNCCGVICRGSVGVVEEGVVLEDERMIYVLDNGALVWKEDTEEVKDKELH